MVSRVFLLTKSMETIVFIITKSTIASRSDGQQSFFINQKYGNHRFAKRWSAEFFYCSQKYHRFVESFFSFFRGNFL